MLLLCLLNSCFASCTELLPNFSKDYSSQVTDIQSVSFNGYEYSFETLKVVEIASGEDYGSLGRISVKNSNGLIVSNQVSRGQPGCLGIPAVQIINIKLESSVLNESRDLVVFCSIDNGLNGVIRIYDPSVGFVSALEFSRILSMDVKYNRLYISIEREEYIDAVGVWSSFPILYTLKNKFDRVYFEEGENGIEFYRKSFGLLCERYKENPAKHLLYRIYLLNREYDLGDTYRNFLEGLEESERKIIMKLNEK